MPGAEWLCARHICLPLYPLARRSDADYVIESLGDGSRTRSSLCSDGLIAVTGGSGFVGSHVVDALLGAGYDVRVIDPKQPAQPNVDWADVDMLDQDSVTDALKGARAVFHLAAMADVNDIVADPAESVALNTLGVARVLEAGRRADAGRVIVSSTVWVYAATHGDVVDETTPFDLNTDRHLYVSEKIAAEMFCRDYATLFGRPYTVLRYGIPFGPRMRSDLVVAAFLLRALRGEPLRIDGDGSQERRFVYVEDLAAAHVLALKPVGEEPHVQPRVERGDLDSQARRDGARPRRRRRGDLRTDASGRLQARGSCRATEPAKSSAGRPRTPLPRACARPSTGTGTSSPPRERAAHRDGSRWSRRTTKSRWSFAVLEELYPLVDELVVVDDGSTDNTRAEIERFLAQGRPNCELLVHETNQGMSEAYFTALTLLRKRLASGELDTDDLVFTVDADGQHDLHVLNELVEMTNARAARREPRAPRPLVPRPVQENRQLGAVAVGEPLGRRAAARRRVGLSHLPARRARRTRSTSTRATSTARPSKSRSCMCQLGYKVRNDHLVPVPVARSRTRLRDAAIDLAVIPVAASRVWRARARARGVPNRRRRATFRSRPCSAWFSRSRTSRRRARC